jgi:hypothetical protein
LLAVLAADTHRAFVLLDAQTDGVLWTRDATMSNSKGMAVHCGGLRVGGDLHLDGDFRAEANCIEHTTVHLSGARVGGRPHLASREVRHSDDQFRWSPDGLTYTAVPLLDGRRDRGAWLNLLRAATPSYAAQPYQQLAATYRAEGHHADVRAILIAQRRDQLSLGGLPKADRFWGMFTGAILGYGYQPWRALLCLVAVLIISVALCLILGAHGALATGPDQRPCDVIDAVGRGMDLGTPFFPRTVPHSARLPMGRREQL